MRLKKNPPKSGIFLVVVRIWFLQKKCLLEKYDMKSSASQKAPINGGTDFDDSNTADLFFQGVAIELQSKIGLSRAWLLSLVEKKCFRWNRNAEPL